MTEQDENTLNRLLAMVQDLDYSAASDGASDCHPSVKTESLYEALAIALRHALADRAQRQAVQEPVGIVAVTPYGGATVGWYPGHIAKHNDLLYAAPHHPR